MSMSSASGTMTSSINQEENSSYIKSLKNSDLYLETSKKDLPLPSFTSQDSSKCITCIIESRGLATEVGITILNLETGICNMYQISDTSNYSKVLQILNLHSPEKVSNCIVINLHLLDHFQRRFNDQLKS